MLLEGSDLQRRSRHIDIKVNWLRELLGKEILQIGHVRGTGNVADHFTKCLPTIKALQYMDILGLSSFEGILLDCLLDFEICDNSFSGILCAFSTRNCMFCGELICEEPANPTTCELSPFPRSCTQMINALVAVCERFQGEGIGSAMAGRIPAEREEPRAPDSHALLGHPTAEGVGAAPESDDTVTIIGGEANTATVAVTSAEAVVPAAEAVPKAAEAAAPPAATEAAPGAAEAVVAEAEDVVEVTPKKAQPPRPKEKAMPTTRGRPVEKARPSGRSQAPGREPAVKKMPRKPGRFVIQVKKEAWEATGLLKRRREAGRRKAKRQAWKNRQKEALAFFAAQRREEESRPTPTYEVVTGSRLPGQRRVMRRMYNPQLNKREELQIETGNPKSEEDEGPAFVRSFSGFSWKNPKGLKCGHCGQRGHIISQCPEMERRVSLTHGRVTLTPRGQHQPDSTVGDEVAPGDSISQVGLTQDSLRIHNNPRRPHQPQIALREPVRGLGWVPLRRHQRGAASFRPAAMRQWRWAQSRLHTRRRGGFRKGHSNHRHHPSLGRPLQRSLLQPRAHYHHRQRPRRHLRYHRRRQLQEEFQVRQKRHPRRLQRRKLESPHRLRRAPVQRQHQLWI